MVPAGDAGAWLAHGLRARGARSRRAPPGGPSPAGPPAWGRTSCGRLEEADRWFAETVARAPDGGQWLAAGAALAYRSLIAGDQGRAEDQRRLAEEATAFATAHDVGEIDGEIPLALGVALAAGGQPAAALPLHRGRPRRRARLGAAARPGARPAAPRAGAPRARPGRPRGGRRSRRRGRSSPPARTRAPSGSGWPRSSARRGRGRRRATPLSRTERRVLRLLAGSLTERELGAELFLTRNTVHTHVTAIYRKLGVASRPAAVARARELGLLGLSGGQRPAIT